MEIAGKKTEAQWLVLKSKLESKPTPELWTSAFEDFYWKRIETRYLRPIEFIGAKDTQSGEGFSITAIFCTLIEFLETCEQGCNFRQSSNAALQDNEYNSSQAGGYFKNFVKTRTPFNKLIPPHLVDSFYSDVRCALLHEARTRSGWVISSFRKKNGILLLETQTGITLYRNQLRPALDEYFGDYRKRLLTKKESQQAFIRKFNALCIP